jgi:hypothetical protein
MTMIRKFTFLDPWHSHPIAFHLHLFILILNKDLDTAY